MERRAVGLAVNEAEPGPRSRERLYVGLSRARDELVVVGSADLIREIGGERVAAAAGNLTGRGWPSRTTVRIVC